MSEPFLICTDLDRTLLPNGSAPESPSARSRFGRVSSRPDVSLAYVTGRHRALVEEAIDEYSLPLPQFVVGDVGTTIYDVDESGWRPWASWRGRLEEAWGRSARQQLEDLLSDLDGLRLQEGSKQGPYKLSYYVSAGAAPGSLVQEIRRRLGRSGVVAKVISSREDSGLGLLDLVPPVAGKLAAIGFLIRERRFDRRRTLFCGDSGNDLEVLTSDIPSVLVANAADEVRREARATSAACGHSPQLYLARGEFLDMNGNYSAGILEGLAHYLPESEAWMG